MLLYTYYYEVTEQFVRSKDINLSCGLATRLESQPLYDYDSTRDLDAMTRDSTRRTRRVCIILKFIVVLTSATDYRHVEIWK